MLLVFESSKVLLEIWEDINKECFGSQLNALSSIGWLDLSGEPDLEEPFGAYLGRQNSIAISRRFYPLEIRAAALERSIANGQLTNDEKNACIAKLGTVLEICYRLVAHETVHQAVLQFDGTTRSHGDEFVKQAERIARVHEITPPSTANAYRWPEVAHLIAKENLNDAINP